ncbi:MAG: hypothetical protein WCJ64_14170 [Rhodospirillaceae bacterium]
MTFLEDFAKDIQDGMADFASEIVYQQGNQTISALGWSNAIDLMRVSAAGVNAGDLMVTLFASSLGTGHTAKGKEQVNPKAGDRVIIEGKARTVLSASTDAAKAIWQLHVRG